MEKSNMDKFYKKTTKYFLRNGIYTLNIYIYKNKNFRNFFILSKKIFR